jgi:hypothetical protein
MTMTEWRWTVAALSLIGTLMACALLPTGRSTETPGPTGTPLPAAATAAPTDEVQATVVPTASPAPPSTEHTLPRLTPGDGFAFRRVDMFDGLHGWAIAGANGVDHLLRTEDGGGSWLDVSPPSYPATGDTQTARMAAAFPAYRLAWSTYFQPDAAPAAATVWWSDNAGGQWGPGDPISIGGGVGMQVLLAAADESHALYIADVTDSDATDKIAAFRTPDGGVSWQMSEIPACDPTGLALAVDGRAWVTEACPDQGEGATTEPSVWQSDDGGASWQRSVLALSDLGLQPPEAAASCRTDDPSLFEAGGAMAITCTTSAGQSDDTLNAVARLDDDWTGYPSPPGQLLFIDGAHGWKWTGEIYYSGDGGRTWSLENQVSWQGQLDFIDRWRGWAVAVNGDDSALVRTTDSGRSYELLKPSLRSQLDGAPNAGCQLKASGSPTTYTRPSYAADVFGTLPGGMPVYLEAKTSDGWLAFDPGVAQAANIGVFHLRWLPPDTDVQFEGNCDGIPIVEGPLPGVCYNMPMGHAAVYQSPDPSSSLLITATTGEYMAVTSQQADGWIRVDLGTGNIGLDLQGWMAPLDINWNGPCPPGG